MDIKQAEDKNDLETAIGAIQEVTDNFKFMVETYHKEIMRVEQKIEGFRQSLDDAVSDSIASKSLFLSTLAHDTKKMNDRLDLFGREVGTCTLGIVRCEDRMDQSWSQMAKLEALIEQHKEVLAKHH